MLKLGLQIGFVPLVDCALLAIAKEEGFFEAHGLMVELRKAQSWTAIRENLGSGQLDAAHLLLTIPIQSVLLGEPTFPALCHAFTLSQNGNGIILSNRLWNNGIRSAKDLACWLTEDLKRSICFGIVHPRGTQEYLLRSWLALGGLSIGSRITLKIIAPQEMVGRLRKNETDGFCAGDPWSRRATASKLGRLVVESRELFPGLGEKVLGVRAAWHMNHKEEHVKLIRSLAMAGAWLDQPENLEKAAEIIASKKYVNAPISVVIESMRFKTKNPPENSAFEKFEAVDQFSPSRNHAQWYVRKMHQFGHADALSCARLNYDTICLEKFYRQTLPMAMTSINTKCQHLSFCSNQFANSSNN